MKNPRDPQEAAPERPAKRPYRKPRLEVYGELGQITGAVSGSKGKDSSKLATH